MTDQNEKAKRDGKDYKVEFSFNFEGIADQVGKMFSGFAEEPRETHHQTELGSTEHAKIKLEAGLGKFSVGTLDLPGTLITVDALHVGRLEFVVSRRDEETNVRLEPQAMSGLRGMIGNLGKRANLYNDVAISPNVPVHLTVETGMGEANLDLTGLNLTHLKVESQVGPMSVHLPESTEGYKTNVEGGIGPVKVYLPANNPAKIKIEGGVGPLSVVIPEDADLDLSIEGGLGPVSVVIAEGTAVQLKKESGLGPFQLPDTLRRGQKDNLYFTDGYDLAQRGVRLFLEGGMGPVRVRFGDEMSEAEEKAKAKAKRKNEEDTEA